MTLDEMIAKANKEAGATRMVLLLSMSEVFTPEIQQAIRFEGMKLLVQPEVFE